jgi:molecular chaperone GrpE
LRDATDGMPDGLPDTDDPGTPGIDDSVAGELNDKLMRLAAEFANHRKRTAHASREAREAGRLDVLSGILPLYDNFVRALDAAESNSEVLPFLEGIEMLRTQFDSFFAAQGLERVACVSGSQFDPNLQEASGVLPSPNEELRGAVAQELQAGFTFSGRLVRAAQVLVYG